MIIQVWSGASLMSNKRNDRGASEDVDKTRRRLLAGLAGGGALALTGCNESTLNPNRTSAEPQSLSQLPAPEDSGIDHIVVVMMENRSFDHFLGWVPGADGIQSSVVLPDSNGNLQASYNLAPQYQNFTLADPNHSYTGGRKQVADGAMDGFLLTQPPGDAFPIGYYTGESLPFFAGCAENWTICDHYFSGILASTTPNRIYMHAGQTDRKDNSVNVSHLPTIWDRMIAAGRSVAYYYADVPYTAFWGGKYRGFSKKYKKNGFITDIASGNLAALTFVDNVGTVLNETTGVSMDDHPYADIRNGQAFLNGVYEALRTSPQWERTLLIINYDEWGGFYDHVEPPFAPVSEQEKKATGNDGRLGCRVPCILAGPRARRGHVEHIQFDPNSILNFIAWRFGFEPLGARADSNNIALALDFANPPDPRAPGFSVPIGPFGRQCLTLEAINELDLVPIPPGLPPFCSPLPGLETPPIPGLDVPQGTETARRRNAHEAELAAIRGLARYHGFA